MTADFTTTQMIWKPRLIRLTHLALPPVDAHPCYVSPDYIALIYRAEMTPRKPITGEAAGPPTECTVVVTTGYGTLSVSEAVDEVARLRDAAFGFKPELREAGK